MHVLACLAVVLDVAVDVSTSILHVERLAVAQAAVKAGLPCSTMHDALQALGYRT